MNRRMPRIEVRMPERVKVIAELDTPRGYIRVDKREQGYVLTHDGNSYGYGDAARALRDYKILANSLQDNTDQINRSPYHREETLNVEDVLKAIVARGFGQPEHSDYKANVNEALCEHILDKISGYLDYLISSECNGYNVCSEQIRAYVKNNL